MGKDILVKCGKGVVYSCKDYTMFYKELNKIMREIHTRPLDSLFNIKYKGFEFNCLPFLLNGTGYFSREYRSSLVDSIARLTSTKEPVLMSEFYNMKTLDIMVFKSLLPALSDIGTRMLGAYQFKHEPKSMVRLLLRGSVEVFEDVIINCKDIHFNYKYAEICNTQAFSYYISVLWLLSLSPVLKALATKDLKRSNFQSTLDSLIPVSSIHYKYISGEIDSKELFNQYCIPSYTDGSSVCIREIMSNSSEGSYSGELLSYTELAICNEVYDTYALNEDYKMNMHLAYCFLFDGTYTRLESDLASKEALIEVEMEKSSRADSKLKRVRADLDLANKELRLKNIELQSLRSELSKVQSNEDLESRLVTLENRVKTLENENNQLFDERLELKKLISTQKKQLKSLLSSHIEESVSVDVFDRGTNQQDGVDLDVAVEFVKNLKLIYIGCDANSLESRLSSYGIDNITRFRPKQRQLGKCDAIIVFTIRCSHDEVYRVEKLSGGRNIPILYLSCINVEQVIEEVYKLLKD